MPHINIKTNKEITKEKEILIKEKLGEAISIIGKNESWLMIEFNSKCTMYFGGSDDDCAYIEVKIFGSRTYDEFTRVLTDLISNELNISSDHIYIGYFETNNWGFNGSNL